MDAERNENTRRRRCRPPRRSGPYAPSDDPLTDARAALERGVAPEQVARRYLAPIVRRRRVAELRALLADHDAVDVLDAVLEHERRMREAVA